VGKGADLREKALASLEAANALVVNDEIPAESAEAFAAHMADFSRLDAEAAQAVEGEEQIGTLKERMAWYTGKVTGTPMRFRSTVLDPGAAMSMGEQFIKSEAYAQLKDSGVLGSDGAAFKSMPVIGSPKAQHVWAAADDIVRTGGGGASALVTPQYLPGVAGLPSRPLVVRDLFGSGQMTSDIVSYAQQTAREGSAAAVAQASSVDGTGAAGGVKPQASATWTRKTSPAETIAVWMATTRQTLADAGQIRSLIDNQLEILLGLEEEDQLINGNGTSPNLSGLLDQDGVQELDVAAVYGGNNLDAVRGSRRLVKTGLSRLTADGILVNPIDSEGFDLLKDEDGNYRGGNPIGNFSFDLPIWALRRVETEAVEAGSPIVGAFRAGGSVLERQPMTILTAEQHADFFVRNLVVILAEERLGFPVFFPSAFVELDLAAWPTVGS
jgi:HK97 family phage major capsid protein